MFCPFVLQRPFRTLLGYMASWTAEILTVNVAASAKKRRLGHGWIFQQDNNPKHMYRSAEKMV